jgi:hypothetical protein
MYHSIEISHPVYATLFFNIIVTLLSSAIDVFVFPFVQEKNTFRRPN